MRILNFIVAVFIVSLCFVSCDDNDNSYFDPQLNVMEYTFDVAGGTLDVYSQKNYQFVVYGTMSTLKDTIYQSGPGEPVYKGWDGGWFRAYYLNSSEDLEDNSYETMIRIEVDKNDTGTEREIPIGIMAVNYICKMKLVQTN